MANLILRDPHRAEDAVQEALLHAWKHIEALRDGTGPAVSITGAAAPGLRDNVLCAEGEVLQIADTATPDIDDTNEICEPGSQRGS